MSIFTNSAWSKIEEISFDSKNEQRNMLSPKMHLNSNLFKEIFAQSSILALSPKDLIQDLPEDHVNSRIATFPTVANTGYLMRFFLEDGQVIGNDGPIFYGITLETAKKKINKIMKSMVNELPVKEIYITMGGPLGQMWQDPSDGKILMFIHRILFDSRKNWERKMRMVFDHEKLHLKGDMNWKNKRERLIEEAVVIAHELMLRLRDRKINEVDEDLKALRKIAYDRGDDRQRESLSKLIQLNRILNKERGLTSELLDYLIDGVLKVDKADKAFRAVVELKIEARLSIRVDLPIEVQVSRINSLGGGSIQPQLHYLQDVVHYQAQVSQAI